MTGEKLTELRLKRGFTRPELANMIGCVHHTIYQWEKEINPISTMAERWLLTVLLAK
jgi:DNA-binding XRE family transcriptional regulator